MSSRASQAAKITSVPKHQSLAEELVAKITAGEHSVGERLPTEAELCAEHGLARGTVRQALRQLEELGMIARRPAVGTIVIAPHPTEPYRPIVQTTDEIRATFAATRLVRPSTSELIADARTARILGLPRGSRWSVVTGLRVQRGRPAHPVCWSDHYLRSEYPVEVIQQGEIPVVPDKFRIEQTISASTLSREMAEALETAPGSPALLVTRRVFEPGGSLIHLETHSHRADQFEVTTVVQPGKTPAGRARKR